MIPPINLYSLRTVSPNTREHYMARARRVKRERQTVRAAVSFAAPRLVPHLDAGIVVTLTRSAPSNGLDDDNLRGALKAARDGVADALGLASDRDPRVTWAYDQIRGPWGVRIAFTARKQELGRQRVASGDQDARVA